jgi:hypothetical protein
LADGYCGVSVVKPLDLRAGDLEPIGSDTADVAGIGFSPASGD